MKGYTAKVPFREEYPDTFALHCSDGRFTDAVHALVTGQGHVTYDTMAMPGGAALLDMSSASIVEVEATRGGTTFLLVAHKIKHAYLIGHTGCGFYKKRYAGQSHERILDRQLRDLKAAAGWMQRSHPLVQIHAYLANPEKTHVVFTPVDITDASLAYVG